MSRVITESKHWSRTVLSLLMGGVVLVLVAGVTQADKDAAAATEPSGTSPGKIEFVGKNLIMKANGTFHDWQVIESAIDVTSIGAAFAVVEVSLASVDTGIDARDDHLRNPDFFEVETYPIATIRIHSPETVEFNKNEDERQRFAVQFDIDLHGVQKTLPGEVVLTGTSPVVFEGSLLIDRTEFGVGPKWNWWSPMTPREEIPVSFRVEL